LLRAADELVADARIGDATYAVLSRALETRQLMDVVFTVGAYELFAMAMRTFDVPLDDDLLPFA
jgi:alkylhydroperoxidase family enzyme